MKVDECRGAGCNRRLAPVQPSSPTPMAKHDLSRWLATGNTKDWTWQGAVWELPDNFFCWLTLRVFGIYTLPASFKIYPEDTFADFPLPIQPSDWGSGLCSMVKFRMLWRQWVTRFFVIRCLGGSFCATWSQEGDTCSPDEMPHITYTMFPRSYRNSGNTVA